MFTMPNKGIKKIGVAAFNWLLALTSPIWMGLVVAGFLLIHTIKWIFSKEISDKREKSGEVVIGFMSIFNS